MTQITRQAQTLESWTRRQLPGGALARGAVLTIIAVVGVITLVVAIRYLAKAIAWAIRRLGVSLGAARRRARAARPAITAQTRFYAEMLATLQRAGVGKAIATPPLAHAEAGVRTRDAGAGERAAELARLYYRARFGERALDQAETRRASTLLRELKRDLSRRHERAVR